MIKNKLKKILKLSSIFLKDPYKNIDIINNNKLNKKSVFLWMIFILMFTLFFISQKVIKYLIERGQTEIFLNVYFLILSIIVMFQTVLVCTNIFYFSKDLEFILPLPIKPVELLVSKFIVLISQIYISEIIFGAIPILIYAIYTNASILFYAYTIIIFIIFPIFLSLFISIIMMFVMKISRFIKNKDLFQIVITLLLLFILFIMEYKVIGNIIENNNEIETATEEQVLEKVFEFSNRIKDGSKYFLVVNPSVEALKKSNANSIIDIMNIAFIDIITFLIFIFIGKITYLKNILKNTIYLTKNKIKITSLHKKCKKRNKSISYIKKEFKNLFRNPMFFMQCVYPVLISIITTIIMSVILIPKLQEIFANEEIRNQIGYISFDITAVYIILGIMQLLFMMSTASLTGFSREGKNAIFVKYIPITYYKQFIYKGIPQIFINTFPVIIILIILHLTVPSIDNKYLLYIFILGFLLNIINSYVMLIVDLIKPKLEWDTEYAVLKQNNNKIFQYVFTICIILLLVYFNNIFEKINMDFAILLTGIIFSIVIIIINILVKIKQNKLFKKIN